MEGTEVPPPQLTGTEGIVFAKYLLAVYRHSYFGVEEEGYGISYNCHVGNVFCMHLKLSEIDL